MQIKRVRYKDIEQIPYFKLKKDFKENFFGSSPAPFVGRFGYPQVNIGLLSPQFSEQTGIYDNPAAWSAQNFPIYKIAGMRYEMVNSRQKAQIMVADQKSRLLDVCQEVGMASKPVELELNLQEKPKLRLEKETEIIPFGPTGKVKKVRITENTKIDQKVDRIVSDIDLKSIPGIWNLYQKGFDQNFLTKLISVGNLGIKKNRRLVPTRWSITAIDDTVGKKLIEEVKDFMVGDYQVHFGGGWGNYYLVLFFPEIWSYELFETYLGYKVNPWSQEGNVNKKPTQVGFFLSTLDFHSKKVIQEPLGGMVENHRFYSTDYENYRGRKNYAEECAGGYYAARIPILEKMKENKRQNSVLALRFITSEYNVPLGVWVCREATRKSLQERPLNFASKELMLKYCQEFIKNKFGFELDLLLKESKLLKEMGKQKKLIEF